MSTSADWAFFLDDPGEGAPVPAVPHRLRAAALLRTARALWLYRRRGWRGAHPYVCRVRPVRGSAALSGLPPATAVRLARREILAAQLVLRAMVPNGLCLPRSLALTVYLCALGLPARMTVARGRALSTPANAFHSWTELHGAVLTDNPDVQLGYTVLQRVP
ncbi:lasso peptide biosynthesis protein [Streptomyces klenkii]|uniref:lasso peptide biosynthesis protein n=1 Tax=Streptomyces klenkii TaxID=1420899 RepID=UPI001319E7A3|nr:lasso peptide biosynthesis protein [Streptomyces klenkii]